VGAPLATARSERLADALAGWQDALDANRGENVLPELGDRLERSANLVFATCATSTAETVTPGGTRSRFDWVIVEEAAKAWPTELAMPLACGTAWTLIGDHRQLGAHRRQDFERFLADCSTHRPSWPAWPRIGRSTWTRSTPFWRLFGPLEDSEVTAQERDRLPLRRLSTQFRMRQPIADVVGRVFYPLPGGPLPDGLPPGGLRHRSGRTGAAGELARRAGRALQQGRAGTRVPARVLTGATGRSEVRR
jgi:hypothetical protein